MLKEHKPAIWYGIIWLVLVAVYWSGLFSGTDGHLYFLLTFYIFPIGGFIGSLIYGRRKGYAKYAFALYACILTLLHPSLTNFLRTGSFHLPSLETAGFTFRCVIAGTVIGMLIRRFKKN